MSGTHAGSVASPFRQPKAVFAVAFACVVSFMGIGLVDPILPAISHELHASPSEVTLLFTSYLVVTAVAMLITNWVSSRIGAKKTLIAGLILIVVFSALAGASPSINGIIGFRAGWGVGNALFIATSLAVIVASASGGFAGAIVLYETALGVGIAIGPLLGGTLGEISWRGPFYGVACLMAIALIATIVLVEPTPKPAHKTGLSAPLRALRHRGLLTMSLTALCYNWEPPRATWRSTARAWTRPGRWSGTTWTGWSRTTSRPRVRSCCTRPTMAPQAGWSPSTPTPSGPARSLSARPPTAGCLP